MRIQPRTYMFTYKDIENLELSEDASAEETAKSLQNAINSGMWSMPGSYGRAMMSAIEDGLCMLGLEPCQDAYGNRIPSRSEVQEGTKGSRGFVVERNGEDWAKMLETL